MPDVAAAAAAIVGAPFRLHGRCAVHGVDCVGLVLLALRSAGCAVPEPPPYRLRMMRLPVDARWLADAGLAVVGDPRTGDILLLNVGPMQRHLGIDMGGGEIAHAHAGLDRVVRGPRPTEWIELARWRVAGG